MPRKTEPHPEQAKRVEGRRMALQHSRACSRLDRGGDGGAVEAFATDHHEPALALLAQAPGPIEIMLHPRAHALHNVPKILAGHMEEALEAEDVVRRDDLAEAREEAARVHDRAARDDEALEVVVIVLGL